MVNTSSPQELTLLVNSGEVNPLEAYIILKQEQSNVETALKAIQDHAINEGLKYGEKSFSAYGAKVEMRNSPSTYKFSGYLTALEEKLKALREQAKIGEIVDSDSGEVIPKAIKLEGKQTISISFK